MECDFRCEYLVKGECQQGGGDCLKEDCPEWDNCESCRRYEDCEV